MGLTLKGKSAAPSKSARDLWAAWWDTKRTSITEAVSVFRIVTDVDMNVENEDDIVPDVPFEMRPRQAEALDTIERYFWKLKRRAARLVCLKSRRYGMTTFFLLLGLERVLRIPGYQVLLVAQDDAMARYHFQRLRDAFQQIPKWALAAQGIEVVKDTDQQLVLRHEGFKTSAFTVAPAKRNALGRGAQYNMLILTEFPSWPKSAKADLSGVLRSCRNVRGNIIVFESTARGYEEFHRRYTRAAKRKSDYRAMFIACYEHPGNRKPFESAEAELEFIKSIGTEKDFGPEDEITLFRKLTVDLKWTPSDAASFLNWRRATLIDDCEGSIDNLHREEPNTAEEAFAGTGIPLFKKEILEAWRPLADVREEMASKGRLLVDGKTLKFFPERRAELVVYERPIPGVRYGFGSDVASGIEVLADGKTEADFSWMCVKRVDTKVTVARFRLHLPPGEFAQAQFNIACWYNGARGYIERSVNDSGVCIDRFEDCEFGGHFGADLLLGQRVLVKTDATNVKANYRWTPGFKTTHKSKPQLVDNIRLEINAIGLPDAEGKKECPFDLQFIDEGGKFERDPKTGRMEAAVGHDDGVIAEGLALEACKRIEEEGMGDAPPAPKGPITGDAILVEFCKQQNAHREDEVVGNEIDGLPGY